MSTYFQKSSIDFFDQDLLKETIQGSSFRHLQMDRGDFRGVLIRAELGPACIDYGHYNLKILAQGEIAHDKYTFGILLQSPQETKLYKNILPVWDIILFPCGYELDVFLCADAQWVCVSFDKVYFENYYKKITGRSENSLPKRPQMLSWQQYDINDLNQILKTILFHKKDFPNERKCLNIQLDLLENLTFLLARSLLGPQEKEITSRGKYRRLQLVKQVEELFESDEFLQQSKMTDICKLFNVSIRTLENAFKENYGLSPAKFLKLVRLNKARSALLNPAKYKNTVTEIAMYYGFMHLSQFASDYQSNFGELPSCTLRRV